jgi:hypothetical protein
MSCFAYFSLVFIICGLLLGCRMPEIASPDEIGKMQDVVEVSDYYDSQCYFLFGKTRPVTARLHNRCRDPEKIKAIMEVVRNIKVNPHPYLIAIEGIDSHLRFRDKSGRVLCLEYFLSRYGKTINGCQYIDKSGDLYDAMQRAGFVGPPIPEPSGWGVAIGPTKRIQILQNVVEIDRYDCDYRNCKNYYEALASSNAKIVKVCTDQDKIALVMEAVRKLDASSKWKSSKDVSVVLSFKSKYGHSFGMILSFVGGKEIEGLDFTDKTGVLYDALQNAGFVGPPLPEP